MQFTKTIISFTKFGETLDVPATIHNSDGTTEYDDTLWVERQEDYYALSAPGYKGKRVAVVKREDWLHARAD